MQTVGAFGVTVNGEAVEVAAGLTVADLVAQLGLDPRKVAVERNEEIVRRSAWASTEILLRDHFEIVHFIGGG